MGVGTGTKSGSVISQQMVCVNGKCKTKMQKCAGKNCQTSYNHNVNINSLKSFGLRSHGNLGYHGSRGGGFGSGFISDLFNWDPFGSMNGLFANIFGGQKNKESNTQAIQRLTQRI